MGLLSGTTAKEFFAAIAAAGTVFMTASADGVLTTGEIGAMVAAFIAGFGITFAVPFIGSLKAIVATAVTVAAAASTAIGNGGGIDGNEWYAIVAIVFTAIGAYKFPNAENSDALV